MKYLLVSCYFLLLVGCIKPPLEHDHIEYSYKIAYGNSPDNLDKLLKSSCSTYYHAKYDYNRNCNYNVDTIGEYTCAVDSRLYLTRIASQNVSQHYVRTGSVTELDNMYCKVIPTVVTKIPYVLNFKHNTDIPKH